MENESARRRNADPTDAWIVRQRSGLRELAAPRGGWVSLIPFILIPQAQRQWHDPAPGRPTGDTLMRRPNQNALLSVEALDDRTLPSGLSLGLHTSLGIAGLGVSLGVQVTAGGTGQTPGNPPPAAAPSSLSGHVDYDDGSGTLHPISDVQISLQDANGNVVANTTTNADGAYSFTGLQAGTYTIVEGAIPQAFSYSDGPDHVGTVNGQPRGQSNTNDQFTVTLGAGEDGVNYDFTEYLAG
jgi:hypothetical protein